MLCHEEIGRASAYYPWYVLLRSAFTTTVTKKSTLENMGRGSSASRKSDENAAASQAHPSFKKKASTWEVPRSVFMPETLADELVDLELELQKKVLEAKIKAENSVEKLTGYLQQALMKLPKDVKSMNVREYVEKYGGNLSNFAKDSSRRIDTGKRRSAAMKTISKFAKERKRDENSGSLQDTSATLIPSTPVSSVRLGPGFLSVKTRKTPGGGLVPYIEQDMNGSNIDSMLIEPVNSILSNFRMVLGKQVNQSDVL
jgi:hypothetical protein